MSTSRMLLASLSLAAAVLLSSCAGRSLPPYEKPITPAPVMKIRTTAYTHSESDHRQYAARNALGTQLQHGPINSAAADWSRFPAGTTFRIVATGEIFMVDDYGWMLAGTNTIDLYKPDGRSMREWGVRRVTIEIIQWGDVRQSYAVLKPREKYRHVRRMVKQIEDRYL
jgi:3D (Asp-Asp-Asp) domain-containing protein